MAAEDATQHGLDFEVADRHDCAMSIAGSRRNDPRDTADGWDGGWSNAVDEGEGFEEYLLNAGDPAYRIERGFYVREYDQEMLGKNEPEDWYLS